ncbi:copper homeostasis protein CutC [Olsenella intestinalis]|uniref:copper homeostasis protein CutC n=1 Tax=Olsenella intestinalis TaxID=2930083 RepID=UPI00200E70B7|nr:copper homeostasis protein CutC [Olsenella intestinalis]
MIDARPQTQAPAALTLEFCAENLVGVEDAIRAGASRVELCDDLSVGGVTPARDVIARAVSLAHGLGATAMVMVRPRGGDFAYDEGELARMERTIALAGEIGADGVVFGCVRDRSLDEEATARLAHAAAGLDMTFHMAFDEISPDRQAAALAWLADAGFSRVLAHGGDLARLIESCLPHLEGLTRAAAGRISVMPGGGVTWENVERVCEAVGASEAHGTRIVRIAP